MIDNRMFLHGALNHMTAEQRVEMARADERALALYAEHRNASDPYRDIRMLADVVALIESERDAARGVMP